VMGKAIFMVVHNDEGKPKEGRTGSGGLPAGSGEPKKM
jgi:hypothetical protein